MYGNEEMVIVTLHLQTLIAQLGSILSWICILASSIPIRKHRWFTVNFTMLKEQELFFIWHLYEEANIFKLHISGVKITTCSFQHIGKSNLRIKEWDYVRKSAWGDKWFKVPAIDIELIVRPINMVNNLNMIYCNNGNGYFSPLRRHNIINTWSILTNEVSKLSWFNFLLNAVFTFE